jgi:hypothetical protein
MPYSMMDIPVQASDNTSGVKRVGASRIPISDELYARRHMMMVSLDTLSHSTPSFCPPLVTTTTIACRPTFAVLPEEIIVKILEWCDFKGVLACQLVRATIPFIVR